jgi:hypothetical protein
LHVIILYSSQATGRSYSEQSEQQKQSAHMERKSREKERGGGLGER